MVLGPDDSQVPPSISELSPVRTGLWTSETPILLVDAGAPLGAGLDHPLADAGFRVFRTSKADSALEILRAHPSLRMAVVRLDLSGVDSVHLMRTMLEVRPGLWVGMLASPASHAEAHAGYRAGASDLLPISANARDTAQRLARSIPWAIRRAGTGERAARLTNGHFRKARSKRLRGRTPTTRVLEAAAAMTCAALLGVALAGAILAWENFLQAWESRVERVLQAIESPNNIRTSTPADFEHWIRSQQLNLERESQRSLLHYRQDQLEEERLKDLLQSVRPPRW